MLHNNEQSSSEGMERIQWTENVKKTTPIVAADCIV